MVTFNIGPSKGVHVPLLLLLGALLAPVKADNPIVQTRYTADPAPMIHDDRVYLFTGHDEPTATDSFDMRDWRLYSTSDMANWQDHGTILSIDDFSWVASDAWAGQVAERDGKFYFYVSVNRKGYGKSIGVGVSSNITGPYEDAIGGPLLENQEIDPNTFIDDDGQAYMFWGNPNLWYVALNDDMISYGEGPVQVELTPETYGPRREGVSDRPTAYEEGPWVYKRDGTYYNVYAANCCGEDIRYSTAPSVRGPWTYRGLVMASEGGSFTNHPGMIDYKGRSYFFYHNGALPGGGGFHRSVAVEEFKYGADGSIPTMVMTEEGPEQLEPLDPYVKQEAETIAFSEGLSTEVCEEGGINVSFINDGDYIKVSGVDFREGASAFTARVASATQGGRIELHLDGVDGLAVGTCDVPGTGGWQEWTTIACDVDGATGTHDLFLVFHGDGSGELFNFNWWQFE
jgi:hypothetical protein